MKKEISQLKAEMTANAKAYNKVLTEGYLNNLRIDQVLNFTHPLERGRFIERLEKLSKERD